MQEFTQEELENEIWKDIPGYEGLYQVSDLGRVKSLGRRVLKCTGFYENKPERILKQMSNGRGYLSVQLYKEDSSNSRNYVHRLSLLAFEGDSDLVADHIDRNRSNNRRINLRYVTQRENVSHKQGGSSKYTGVVWNKKFKKWVSVIRIETVKYYLGGFKDEVDAANAYQIALLRWETEKVTPYGENVTAKATCIFKRKSQKTSPVNRRKVINTETGKIYDCLKDAAEQEGLKYKYLSSMLTGKRKNTTPLKYL